MATGSVLFQHGVGVERTLSFGESNYEQCLNLPCIRLGRGKFELVRVGTREKEVSGAWGVFSSSTNLMTALATIYYNLSMGLPRCNKL